MGRAAKRKRRCKTCGGAGLVVSEPPTVTRGTNFLGGPLVIMMSVEHLCPKCTLGAAARRDYDYSKPGRLLP